MTENEVMQWGPVPEILADLVERVKIEPGWYIRLTDPEYKRDDDHGRGSAGGLTLIITATVPDTYHPDLPPIGIRHYFPVPGATYNEGSWMRWVFDCYTKVRLHECMEYFKVQTDWETDDECVKCQHAASDHDGRDSGCYGGDGSCENHRFVPKEPRYHRPYVPNHGPGENVYIVREMNTEERARTQFTGGLDHK